MDEWILPEDVKNGAGMNPQSMICDCSLYGNRWLVYNAKTLFKYVVLADLICHFKEWSN